MHSKKNPDFGQVKNIKAKVFKKIIKKKTVRILTIFDKICQQDLSKWSHLYFKEIFFFFFFSNHHDFAVFSLKGRIFHLKVFWFWAVGSSTSPQQHQQLNSGLFHLFFSVVDDIVIASSSLWGSCWSHSSKWKSTHFSWVELWKSSWK